MRVGVYLGKSNEFSCCYWKLKMNGVFIYYLLFIAVEMMLKMSYSCDLEIRKKAKVGGF